MPHGMTGSSHPRRRRVKALRQLRRAAAPRLLRLARRKLRHAVLMRELWIESEKQLDRYIERWARKLLLVETVKGRVRARHLTPDEIESAIQGSATASADTRNRSGRSPKGTGSNRASGKTAASKSKRAVHT